MIGTVIGRRIGHVAVRILALPLLLSACRRRSGACDERDPALPVADGTLVYTDKACSAFGAKAAPIPGDLLDAHLSRRIAFATR
jgi:hypothetical protein